MMDALDDALDKRNIGFELIKIGFTSDSWKQCTTKLKTFRCIEMKEKHQNFNTIFKCYQHSLV